MQYQTTCQVSPQLFSLLHVNTWGFHFVFIKTMPFIIETESLVADSTVRYPWNAWLVPILPDSRNHTPPSSWTWWRAAIRTTAIGCVWFFYQRAGNQGLHRHTFPSRLRLQVLEVLKYLPCYRELAWAIKTDLWMTNQEHFSQSPSNTAFCSFDRLSQFEKLKLLSKRLDNKQLEIFFQFIHKWFKDFSSFSDYKLVLCFGDFPLKIWKIYFHVL